jgi:hypothetical protein
MPQSHVYDIVDPALYRPALEAPELKAEIIEPLEMQGVDEVADNALVIRFKYKARPDNPGAIQNAAVTRMLRTLPTLGIEFDRPACGRWPRRHVVPASTSTGRERIDR